MQKIAAETKNKVFFYLATSVLAIFLAVSFMPQANAESLGDDLTPPDDVENLQIEMYDGAALLSWDVATDDTGVVGYKIYSGPEAVTAESGEYSNDVMDAGDVIEYLVEDLENGVDVYFAVTAYDAAGNESENYSNEAYGSPDPTYGTAPVMHMAADEEPPTVTDAQALDTETVQVVFSEAVMLPSESPESAFTIINNASSEALAVTSVELDTDDVLGSSLLLSTDPQESGAEYILTAGIQIEDTAGNPIVSGTSDTAAFIGSVIDAGADLGDDLPTDDFDAPTVVSAESKGETSVQVNFSEAVILDSDPETNFFVAEESDATNQLDILSVERNTEGDVITITTSAQQSVTYSVVVTGVLDEGGNEIDSVGNNASFEGNNQLQEIPDPFDLPLQLTSKNVKNFAAAIVNEIIVKLTWDALDDPSIIDQILYKSIDGGDSYDDGTSLGTEKEFVELTGLTPGHEYFFKLTTKDLEGNESTGMITSITLPETGLGLGLLVGASMGLAALRRRKK